MNRVTVILFHGVLLVFVHKLALIIAAQQVENFIVPRTTLELSTNTNKTAEGHKKICTSDLDCESYTNNKCCRTVSGYFKCRTKCRAGTKWRQRRRRRSRRNGKRQSKYKERKMVSTTTDSITLGCEVNGNKVYKEGEVILAKDGCNDCKCTKGRMNCTNRRCLPGKCAYKNRLYEEGYRLVLHNGCKKCICKYSSWDCASHPCEKVVKKPQSSSTMLIIPSEVLPFICSIVHLILLK